jgi:hypothetical protein
MLTRADFKVVVNRKLRMTLTGKQKGKLRKQLDPLNTKLIGLSGFEAFFGQKHTEQTSLQDSAAAALPVDVPTTPDK